MLGNFAAQMDCCDTRVRTTESITITHTCDQMNGIGYIHKYSGTDQTPGSDTLTCTPEKQGDGLSLNDIAGYTPLFPYYCLSKFGKRTFSCTFLVLQLVTCKSGTLVSVLTIQIRIVVPGRTMIGVHLDPQCSSHGTSRYYLVHQGTDPSFLFVTS